MRSKRLTTRHCYLLAVLSLISTIAQAAVNQPHIGYLYPAGGQQGQEFLIVAGGQFLQRPQAVYVTGEGINVEIVQYYRPIGNIQKEQRDLLIERMKEVRDKRLAELSASVRAALSPKPSNPAAAQNANKSTESANTTEAVKLPASPLLYELDNQSLRQLGHIWQMLFIPRSKIQQNRQLGETVLLKVTIAPDAEPGMRELRINAAAGLTNPIAFQVGTLAEYTELEPNDWEAYPVRTPRIEELPAAAALELPIVLNGQIMPGDIDRFRFRATAGQQLVIQTHARSLIQYLPDAVPGWLQAAVSLYDAAGNEMAFADDYQFNPDPVLFYKIPKTGEYELAVRDSIYRGREDFVYRIAVGELPFITQMFPLGGRQGQEITAAIEGWNLPAAQLTLDTATGGPAVRQAVYKTEETISNMVPYAVDTLPQCTETSANNSMKEAQSVRLPIIIDGQVSAAGQSDFFKFQGNAGEEISVEVCARRLNSPLDSLLRLTDASGKVLAWNDDYVVKDTGYLFKDAEGLLTHHADASLTAKLPADGTYYVQLTDTRGHGGKAFAYRLHLAPRTPDFALRITPSGLSPLPGEMIPITVYVLRKNGFDGPIDVALKDAPQGFKLEGGRIPAHCEHIRMTLAAPNTAMEKPVALQVEGRAMIGDQPVIRRAVGAEDRMQAYLYRHLVPSQELLVAMRPARRSLPAVELAGQLPVTLAVDGTAEVRLKCSARQFAKELRLTLQDPPKGISLHDVKVVPDGLVFSLKADGTVEKQLVDNLIVEAVREYDTPAANGQPARKRLQPVGVLPAIPIRVTDPVVADKTPVAATTQSSQ